MEQSNNLIDIEAIIQNKNPNLYKKLPGFVINWLKKIICQDKINRLLTLYGHLQGVEFIDAVFADFNVDINCYGLENLKEYADKRLLFVANHPLGGIDGLAVISAVNKNFRKATAVVNELLLNINNLREVFCGVNVYGHNTPKIFENIDNLFNSEDDICIFPAGMCSRKINGKIQDLKWKKNFIEKAYKHEIPIVPIFVDAVNSSFFYNVANLRKKLGIKFNYELVLLPSEVFKYHDKPINLYFGRPVEPSVLSGMINAEERTQYVRSLTYNLQDTIK